MPNGRKVRFDVPSQRTWLLYLVFTLIAVGWQLRERQEDIAQLEGTVAAQRANLALREAQLSAQVARLDEAGDHLARAKTILQEAESNLRVAQKANETGQHTLAEVSTLVTSIEREAVVSTASRSALRAQVLACDLRVALATFANQRPLDH